MSIVTIRHFSLYRDPGDGNMDRTSGLAQYRHEALYGIREQYIRERDRALHGYFVHGILLSSGEVYRNYGTPDPYEYENDWGDEDFDDGWGDDE